MFRPGLSIYIPGATAELRQLHSGLQAEPDRLRGIELTSCLIPGMNSFDYAALEPTARLTTFLLPPPLRPSFEAGRVRALPMSYSQIARHLAALSPAVAILHVTPPQGGFCSLGTCADFGSIVASNARRLIGVVNPALARPLETSRLPVEAFDALIELEDAPTFPAEAPPSPDLRVLANHVANLVPDGAAVQTGIGAAPSAVWRALIGHKDLKLRSGMVTDGFLDAFDAGAMAANGHVAGVAFGSERLHERLHASDLVAFADVRRTHGAQALAGVKHLVAINSAIEVDLFGQANLEWQAGKLISGAGGAPDFARAGRASSGGRSILALPATARQGTASRISARLKVPASLARTDIDTVVTEYGVAHLTSLSMDERAEALIEIAAPSHREALTQAWQEMKTSF
ncbi:acetyl-CoA hydrolase/transferase C-terminal domain-containing protein [Phenylobacterium sp.]|uniref:acetyl-CoA hydrolase/transferase family protein n=1 Tax=Phenylobacterium sp. TaxID=1871053 RepID=UPI002897615F|nr:acetyl-CoA hydrolase/transferase C-terminal domain-containing protein [Phenylobacterium sp.]